MTPGTVDDELRDTLAIRELVERWVVWRDAGDWDRFRTLWFDDGRMMATWTQGTADEFIAMSREGWERGVEIHHVLGGQAVDVAGDRAVSQVKMEIHQRATVDGVEVDVTCTGRFYDFLERRAGRWGLVLRQPIYERDRMDPVDPSARLELDRDLLGRFPAGYRHLAYLQTRIGYDVKADMPGLRGPEVDALYASGAAWLRGEPLGSPMRDCLLRRFRRSGTASATSRSLKAACSLAAAARRGSQGRPPPARRRQACFGQAPAGARTRSLRTENHGPWTFSGRSGSSAARGTKSRSSDGLTANTASESRYALSRSKMCVVTGA